ncbi:MAG: AraC-like DNA-binding protein [Polaribacter sp.]
MAEQKLFFQDDSLYIDRQNYVKKHSDMSIHDHDYLTISLLLNGTLIEHTPDATKIVKPGNVLIKPPGVMHGNIFTENCSILSFKLFDYKYYNFKWKQWNIIEQSGFLKHFLYVLHHKDRKHSFSELKNKLISIDSKENTSHMIPEKIRHVKHLIEVHFAEATQIYDLAKEVNLNPAYLGQVFKQSYNMDIKSYQQQLRLHYSVSEMFTPDLNLTQIAHNTGFSDQSHFSRIFKKSTDISPKRLTSKLNL